MRKVRLKDGNITVYVVSNGEPRPPGEIVFTEDEFAWAMKNGKDVSDAEATRAFWETLLEKKLANPNYSLFTDLPKDAPPPPRPPEEILVPAPPSLVKQICAEFIEKRAKAKAAIEAAGHLPPKKEAGTA